MSFFAYQAELRRALAFKHQEELTHIFSTKNYVQRADLIRRQINELFDFRIQSQEMRACIMDIQQKEKDAY